MNALGAAGAASAANLGVLDLSSQMLVQFDAMTKKGCIPAVRIAKIPLLHLAIAALKLLGPPAKVFLANAAQVEGAIAQATSAIQKLVVGLPLFCFDFSIACSGR